MLGFFCCFPDFLVLNFSSGLTALWHISPPSYTHFFVDDDFVIMILFLKCYNLVNRFFFFPDLLVLNFGLCALPSYVLILHHPMHLDFTF